MKLTRKNKITIMMLSGLSAMLVVFIYLLLFDTGPKVAVDADTMIRPSGPVKTTPGHGAKETMPGVDAADGASGAMAETEKTAFEDQVVRELVKNYGKTIAQKSTQASLINVKRYILSLFPGKEGEDLFSRAIRRAFPEFADSVFDTLARLEAYHEWLDENAARMSQMSEAEKNAFLWEKRQSLFEEDALEIWSGELLATDARKKAMQETMAALEQSYDTTIEEKLDLFQNALRQTYENTAEEFVLEYKDMSTKVFFSLQSVQDELQQMNPEQRRWEMNKVRREMGFTEEQVEKMAEYDAIRDQRWEIGYQYMNERDELVSKFEGEELQEKLKAAREKYFHDEAGTIELEENQGFYRFLRPRVYGRN